MLLEMLMRQTHVKFSDHIEEYEPVSYTFLCQNTFSVEWFLHPASLREKKAYDRIVLLMSNPGFSEETLNGFI